MPETIILMGEERMEKTIESLKKDLGLVRTGRANPSVLNDVRVNFKTKVESYGINSILVELYLVMEVKSWFVNPFNDGTFGEQYEYVLSSRIVNGDIPIYYGDNIEKSSSIVSS